MPDDAASIAREVRRYQRQRLDLPGFRRAAVLVPVLRRRDGLHLLFTVRASHLPNHAGQIAFPGGGLEEGEDVVEAALRETREEIAVDIPREAVLGCLDDLPSPAKYVATPVVALVDADVQWRADPREVDEVFVAPLDELRAVAPRWEERVLERMRRRIHFYEWRGRTIWGFTGNVLHNFLAVTSDSGA